MLVDKIIKLARQGYTDAQIIKILKEQGYTPKDINDALNQAKIKLEMNKTIEIPTPSSYNEEDQGYEEDYIPEVNQESYEAGTFPVVEREPSVSMTEMEEVVSELVEEKWQEFQKRTSEFFDIAEKIDVLLKRIEKRIERNELIIKRLGDAAKQKFFDQDQEIKKLKAEVKALTETLNKLMKPLVGKIKEESGLLKVEEEKKENKKDKKKTLDTMF